MRIMVQTDPEKDYGKKELKQKELGCGSSG
jgi:hypothetical protein